MARQRDIILGALKTPNEVFRLQEHLRELYRFLDRSQQTITYAAAITVDASIAKTFFVTLTGNITGITISNADTGRQITFIFLQDAVGNRTVAGWPATVHLAGGSFTATVTASKYSIVTFEYVNSLWVEISRSLNA